MNNPSPNQTPDLLIIVNSWKLNKALLASKIEMNPYTFKMKMLGTNPKYKFTDAETERLSGVLKELAADIENVYGISFNAALAAITRKRSTNCKGQ